MGGKFIFCRIYFYSLILCFFIYYLFKRKKKRVKNGIDLEIRYFDSFFNFVIYELYVILGRFCFYLLKMGRRKQLLVNRASVRNRGEDGLKQSWFGNLVIRFLQGLVYFLFQKLYVFIRVRGKFSFLCFLVQRILSEGNKVKFVRWFG